MSMIICGSDCADCKHSSLDDSDKARIKVHCSARDKDYYYGQSISCEDKEKKK